MLRAAAQTFLSPKPANANVHDKDSIVARQVMGTRQYHKLAGLQNNDAGRSVCVKQRAFMQAAGINGNDFCF